MGMGTLCNGKKAPIYGHRNTLHWQKGPHNWAWGLIVLAKRPPYMGMGTLCTSKQAPIPGYGDTLPIRLMCPPSVEVDCQCYPI